MKHKNLNQVTLNNCIIFFLFGSLAKNGKKFLMAPPKKVWSSLTFFLKHYRYCWCHKNWSKKSAKIMPMKWFHHLPSDQFIFIHIQYPQNVPWQKTRILGYYEQCLTTSAIVYLLAIKEPNIMKKLIRID